METNEDTGNGQSAVLAIEESVEAKSGASTAVGSKRSRKNSSQNASKKERLDTKDVLSILENALWRVSQYWQPARIIPPQDDSTPIVFVLPVPIRYCQKCQHLRLDADMEDGVCKNCRTGTVNGENE